MSLTNSVAGGSTATVDVNHSGCFVWSDSTGVLESTTGVDQFRIRADGGTFMSAVAESNTAFDKLAWNSANGEFVLNPNVAISAYNTGNSGNIPNAPGTSTPGTPLIMPLNAVSFNSDSGFNEDFTFSGNAITVTRPGVYEISFHAGFQTINASSNRVNIQAYVTRNGTTFAQVIPSLVGYSYHRGFGSVDAEGSKGTAIVALNASDVLRLYAREYYVETAGGGNQLRGLANACRLTVRRI